jgi:hypothetical protein
MDLGPFTTKPGVSKYVYMACEMRRPSSENSQRQAARHLKCSKKTHTITRRAIKVLEIIRRLPIPVLLDEKENKKLSSPMTSL